MGRLKGWPGNVSRDIYAKYVSQNHTLTSAFRPSEWSRRVPHVPSSIRTTRVAGRHRHRIRVRWTTRRVKGRVWPGIGRGHRTVTGTYFCTFSARFYCQSTVDSTIRLCRNKSYCVVCNMWLFKYIIGM